MIADFAIKYHVSGNVSVHVISGISRVKYTVPLMFLRTLPVTSTCPYVENSTIITGYQATSGWLNLLPGK